MSRHEPGRDASGGPGAPVVRRGVRRRTVVVAPLAVVVTAAAAACTGRSDPPAPTAGPSPTPVDPDDALRAAAAAREQGLLQAYDAVLTGLPQLAARLDPLRAHHREHLRALQGPDASPSPSAAAPSAAPPTASPAAAAPASVPASADAALRSLVTAERTAGGQHADDCLAASRGLAGLLGALSASELTHAAALA